MCNVGREIREQNSGSSALHFHRFIHPAVVELLVEGFEGGMCFGCEDFPCRVSLPHFRVGRLETFSS